MLKFDYVVLGAGAAGCVMASEIARSRPESSVLVLERGADWRHEDLTMNRNGWPRVLNESVVKRTFTEDGVWTLTANVLGGGTSINAGLWCRAGDTYFHDSEAPGGAPWDPSVDVGALYDTVERKMRESSPFAAGFPHHNWSGGAEAGAHEAAMRDALGCTHAPEMTPRKKPDNSTENQVLRTFSAFEPETGFRVSAALLVEQKLRLAEGALLALENAVAGECAPEARTTQCRDVLASKRYRLLFDPRWVRSTASYDDRRSALLERLSKLEDPLQRECPPSCLDALNHLVTLMSHNQNLTVRTHTRANKLCCARPRRVSSVECTDLLTDAVFQVCASERVYLCCGAVESVALVLRSGIPCHEETGRNLKDKAVHSVVVPLDSSRPHSHMTVEVMGLRRENGTIDGVFEQVGGGFSATETMAMSMAMFKRGRGRHISNGDVRRHKLLNWRTKMHDKLDFDNMVALVAALGNPLSLGTVGISTKDPHVPVICLNLLQHEADMTAQLLNLEVLAAYARSEKLAPIKWNASKKHTSMQLFSRLGSLFPSVRAMIDEDSLPALPASNDSRARQAQWLNDRVVPGFHMVGSCSKAVDEQLRLLSSAGTYENLFVVDASVLPSPPAVNIQATVMMLALYALQKCPL